MDKRSGNAFGLLRYYAAFCVMFLHFTGHVRGNLPEYADRIGILRSVVDFFQPTVIMFAISGFLISASMERSELSVKTFAKKRFFRLYPDLWLSMAIYLGVLFLIVPKKFNSSIFKWIITQGIGIASTPSCLKKFGTGSINGPMWYLTVLLQLYIVLFIFKRLTNKKNSISLYTVILVLLTAFNVLSYFAALRMGGTFAKLIERFFLPYAVWFFIGVFLQTFGLHENKWRNKAFAVLLIIHCFFKITGLLNIGYYTGVITGLTTAVLTVLAAFILKPIKIKTDLSYGMYLYHWLFLNIIIHYKLYLKFHWLVCLIFFTLATILFSYVFRTGLWSSLFKKHCHK